MQDEINRQSGQGHPKDIKTLLCSDLDDTLNPPGKVIEMPVAERLCDLLEKYQSLYVAMATGKPLANVEQQVKALENAARWYELMPDEIRWRTIAVYTNGAGNRFYQGGKEQILLYGDINPNADEAINQVNGIAATIRSEFPGEFTEQDNVKDENGRWMVFTPFPSERLTPQDLGGFARNAARQQYGENAQVTVHVFKDAIDILPTPSTGLPLDKGTSVELIAKTLGINFEQAEDYTGPYDGGIPNSRRILGVGFGDGPNDLCFFRKMQRNVTFSSDKSRGLQPYANAVVDSTLEGLEAVDRFLGEIYRNNGG
ncbi:hypothetical protein HYU14_04345 [Candidatus Woesearchaeota archaeon]|nr:hypothetical protein [Candidatus Woesearchaeota archaeon]